ncbi:hypothetical protein FQN57_004701 [Myotisia sp. PD_48]|nr:hypothetical protein FQN57_004701 [Myotisia sp. PD_48]
MGRYIIRLIEESDWDQLLQVQFRSFAQEQFCHLVRGENTASNREICRNQYLSSNSNDIWVKVIDADDKPTEATQESSPPNTNLLGAACYRVNPFYSPTQNIELDPESFVWLDDPEERQVAVAMLHDVLDRGQRFIKGPHIQLFILFVEPEHQKKGIGSMLLQWGIDLANHMMLPLWVEASTAARSLYMSHGFKEQVKSKIVMGTWDIEYSILKRDPN